MHAIARQQSAHLAAAGVVGPEYEPHVTRLVNGLATLQPAEGFGPEAHLLITG